MVFQEASFPARQAKKVNDWSPIDRMLANKRGQQKPLAPAGLPPLQDRQSPPRPHTTTGSTQTASWTALAVEIAAPEKSRANVLEKELKSVRALLKQLEEGAKDAGTREADEQRRAAELEARLEDSERQRRELEAELQAARQAAAEATSSRDEQRRRFEIEQREWQEERAALKEEASRCFDLRRELEKRNVDLGDLRKAYNKLVEESKAVGEERDQLMQRLEVEQAEMMKRVEQLEMRGGSKR